jgi:DNA-directed RNA polymerase subunit RPC12/RpoP
MLFIGTAHAQDNALTISLRRDFGYSSGGGDIQGLFSITASGPQDLSRVVFYIDHAVISEINQPPFKIQFNTDKYPNGIRQIYAVGLTTSGKQLQSQIVTANFVSAEAGTQSVMRIVIPILGITLLAVLLAAVVPLLTGRKVVDLPAGAQRSYSMGGAICPKCQRPFGVHIYGLNLLMNKYDRCPYCGKWSLVKYAPMDKLRIAEQAELIRSNEKAQVPGMSEEEKLKKELEDSRYHEI